MKKIKVFDKIQILVWGLVMIAGIWIAYHYINAVIEIQERYKLLANLGMMLATLGAAFLIYFLTINYTIIKQKK